MDAVIKFDILYLIVLSNRVDFDGIFHRLIPIPIIFDTNKAQHYAISRMYPTTQVHPVQ